MKKFSIILLFFIFVSNSLIANSKIDQWQDTKKTYIELIEKGFNVKAYDMTNFKDDQGNLYLFCVTVLQKEKEIYECQEYQIFNNMMETIDLTFICRKLVKPYNKGLKT